MTLSQISIENRTRKFRCRRVADLQDFLVLGPTKIDDTGIVVRFSVLNLDTDIYHDTDAFVDSFVLLSSNIELGYMTRLGDPQIIKAVKEKYQKK